MALMLAETGERFRPFLIREYGWIPLVLALGLLFQVASGWMRRHISKNVKPGAPVTLLVALWIPAAIGGIGLGVGLLLESRGLAYWGTFVALFFGITSALLHSRYKLHGSSGLQLPKPWFGPDRAMASRLEQELASEIAPGHDLADKRLQAVGRCSGCNTVVFEGDEPEWAIVELTWSGHQETPPGPPMQQFRSKEGVESAITAHHHQRVGTEE